MSLQRFSTFQGTSANPQLLVASDDSKLLGHALLGLSHTNHQHSQSIGDLANLKIRSPPTPLTSSDRQSSSGANNGGSGADVIPPLQHKKGRSSIVAGGGQIAGNLAPLGLSTKSDNANSVSASVATPAGGGGGGGGNPTVAFAAAPTGKPRPPAVLASFRDSFEQQPGSPAPASSPAYDPSSTPERNASSSKLVPNSLRSLSPLVRNNLPAVNSPQSQQPTLQQQQQQQQPLGSQPQQVSPQQPVQTLSSKSTHPCAAGIIINLQVGDKYFLTTPETLLRYHQLEGIPPTAVNNKGASSSAADSAATCTPLLVWIAEEALSKLTVNSPTAITAGDSSTIISGASSLRPPSLSPSTMPSRSHSIPTSTEPSPRGPTAASGPSSTTTGQQGFAHAAAQFNNHPHQNGFSCYSGATPLSSPHITYSLFIDRNPQGFGPLLDYLRDGAPMFRANMLPNLTEPVLAALLVESEFFSCPVLLSLVSTEISKRNQNRNLNPDDLFWREVMEKLDQLYPEENQTLVEAISSTAKLQRNLGSMLRRLAFQRDPMLRVCHATYSHTNEYQERLLEILWTTCTLCQRRIFFKAIGRREGRESGCPVHPASGQWDRKNRMWTCCGSPEFKNSGCETTGIHYTQWSFWSAMDNQ